MKIGVVGAGHLGKIHIRLLKEIPEMELIGFYDSNVDAVAKISADLGVKAFADFAEMLALCDAVDVVSPTTTHYEYAAAVIRANKHCFVEKPLSSTLAESEKLVSLAHEAGVTVQVGHVERFNPAFVAARPFIEKPMFIESHRLALFNPRGTDVPVVYDLMIHDIDIVLSVVKSNIRKVSANAVAVVSDSADIANARLEFDNGCVANLTASRISMKNMRKIRFFQRDAYVSVDFYEKQAEVIRIRETEKQEGDGFIIDLGPEKGRKEIYFSMPEIPDSNAIKQELISFYEAIKNGTPAAVSVEDGCSAMQVAEKIMEKISFGG